MLFCNSDLENANLKIHLRIILIFLITAFPIFSQSEIPDMVTDRPDVTESALSVPAGILQFETGISYNEVKFKEDEINYRLQNISIFSSLFRYGVIPNLEFRFGGGYFSSLSEINSESSTVGGIGDLMIGAKYVIRKDCTIISNVAILAETILPFGGSQIKPEKFSPKILLAADQEINNFSGIAVNLGTEFNEDLDKYIYSYSVSLGLNVSDRVGGFVEVFGNAHKQILPENSFDFGFTYRQSKNIQLDCSLGTSLKPGITNWFMGVGVSLRFVN